MEQHPLLLTSSQIGEALRGGRIVERVEPVTEHTRIAEIGFLQFLASHALDGIAPQAFNLAYYAHDEPPRSIPSAFPPGLIAERRGLGRIFQMPFMIVRKP